MMVLARCIWVVQLIFVVTLILSCDSASDKENKSKAEARTFFQYDSSLYEPVAIDYHVYGENDTTLLFIHGWNLNQTYWDFQVKNLSSKYKVITLDLAGHGKSGKNRENWTIESFAKDIVSIIQKDSIQKIVLIGHSIGGEIALDVYQRIPDRIIGLIGVDNFKDIDFDITPEFKNGFEKFLTRFQSDFREQAGEMVSNTCKSTDQKIVERVKGDYLAADPKIALQVFKNMVPKYEQERKQLRKIKLPLKIIASDLSPYNMEALQRFVKSGYEIEWIRGSGHFPMIEKPKPFQRAIEKTLNKIFLKYDSLSKPSGH